MYKTTNGMLQQGAEPAAVAAQRQAAPAHSASSDDSQGPGQARKPRRRVRRD
jgi:hypothetical protein